MDNFFVCLIMIILLGIENEHIDYIAAYLQDSLDHVVYVEMSKMSKSHGKVWWLKHALNGLEEAP